MPPIYLLSCQDLRGHVSDEHLLVTALRDRGATVHYEPWDVCSPEPGSLVIIRTPWDYRLRWQEFLARLEGMRAAGVRVHNSIELVKWNIHKSYLLDLHGRGIPVVPTVFLSGKNPGVWHTEDFQGPLVVKPAVGAGGHDTFKVMDWEELRGRPDFFVQGQDFMVQPFVESIETEGELSLIYFRGKFSHGVRKIPRVGEFRSQEEYGAQLLTEDPGPLLRRLSENIFLALPERPLYARLDWVDTHAEPMLMELELIEPSLYYRMESRSLESFADQIQILASGV